MSKGLIARVSGFCLLAASIGGCLSSLFMEDDFRGGTVSAVGVPELTGRVVDLADAFTPKEAERLTEEIKSLEAATKGGQFVVLAVPTLGGIPIEEYSIKVASTWKLGQKGVDNGALFVFATQDHKTRLEIGYGWEGQINDAKAGDVLRAIVPYFRANDFAGGTALVIRSVRSYITGEELVALPVGDGHAIPEGEGSSGGHSSDKSSTLGVSSIVGMITAIILWICGIFRGDKPKALALARSKLYARIGLCLMLGSIGGCIGAGIYDYASAPGRGTKTADELVLPAESPCVLDFTETIKPAELSELEAAARSIEAGGGKLRIVIVSALGTEELESFSEKTAAKYGLTQASNGALLVMAIANDDTSFRVYGDKWRGVLGRARVESIRMGAGRYLAADDCDGAVRSAVLSLKAALSGAAAPELPAPVERSLSLASWAMVISIGLFGIGIVYWFLSRFIAPTSGRGSSDGGGSSSNEGSSSGDSYSGGGGSFGGGGASGSW